MNVLLRNIVKVYEQFPALEIEEWSIKSGALWGLIGPNGAGKSTLSKIIGRLEAATAGEISYDGNPYTTQLQKEMTVVFQKPYLLRTTVWENIAYPLKIRGYGTKEIKNAVEDILYQMEIGPIMHQKSWTLSGGEAQKVALARALVFKPRLLILDEPTANIDPAAVAVMEKMIRRANEEAQITVLMVTHSLQQAKRLCKEVAFMHRGKIVEAGPTEQILYHPSSALTKKFVQGELLID
ncbi:carbohydrate ABC transporter ATP-binding protein, CUT1 family [Geosporobacter subterraneus DSM 17957]|uniref:Carbohydrate ABC transporter ATP-binding protein, CUT1 family n=1 Tax=Geosporobacter subterraneus DSM 17957 TaxID=1121919 RepID=A0A1M6JAN7_9FIRM|nr:ATP-binding cassette domain-containing protein [Geosporobacter subterraneus]SHJ43757.1 carbohydrate ABC transporter ATP-binding protein, CUT1 family [Geosporobacter subterraneus DSM 17957]